jgi:hypothetical protein
MGNGVQRARVRGEEFEIDGKVLQKGVLGHITNSSFSVSPPSLLLRFENITRRGGTSRKGYKLLRSSSSSLPHPGYLPGSPDHDHGGVHITRRSWIGGP